MSTITTNGMTVRNTPAGCGGINSGLSNSAAVWKKKLGVLMIVMCFIAIASVSTLDALLVAWNPQIVNVEKNPICLALIQLDPNGLSAFYLGKSIGTLTVLGAIALMFKIQFCHANTVLIAITCFQVWLLAYLFLSDPLMHGFPNFALLFRDTPESIFNFSYQ